MQHGKKVMKKLPDAEFAVMKAVWECEPPVTTNIVMEQLGEEKSWKAQTVVSLLLRLVERGFLHTEKKGRERIYFPLINQEDYLKFETDNFIKQYYDNSLFKLVNTLYDDNTLTEKDIEELLQWAKDRRG